MIPAGEQLAAALSALPLASVARFGLLIEARKPAIINVAGIWQAVHDGDRLRLDGRRGLVEVLPS
jgi:hypothetical protein